MSVDNEIDQLLNFLYPLPGYPGTSYDHAEMKRLQARVAIKLLLAAQRAATIAECIAALPEKKLPYMVGTRPTFIEPIIAETVNSPVTIEPWVNKGYNAAITEMEKLLGGNK